MSFTPCLVTNTFQGNSVRCLSLISFVSSILLPDRSRISQQGNAQWPGMSSSKARLWGAQFRLPPNRPATRMRVNLSHDGLECSCSSPFPETINAFGAKAAEDCTHSKTFGHPLRSLPRSRFGVRQSPAAFSFVEQSFGSILRWRYHADNGQGRRDCSLHGKHELATRGVRQAHDWTTPGRRRGWDCLEARRPERG